MYQHSTHFCDIYQYITDGKLPSSVKVQNCIRAEALNYVVINNFLFRIDTRKDRDLDKGNLFLLVILEKYKPIIFNTYHDSLLAGHQGPYHALMIIRQKFFIHNLMNKVKRYIEACHTCLKTKMKYMKNQPIYGRIPVDYAPMQDLSIDLTTQPQQHPRSLNNKIISRQMINEINVKWEESDRLTVAKLNTVKQFNKQDHKSKLMTEKYSLLPLNPQQLTPVQTATQRMSEKHPDFEIEPVNTI